MSEIVTPLPGRQPHVRVNRSAGGALKPAGRWIIAAVMMVAGVAIVASEAAFRAGETQVLAWLVGHTFAGTSIANTSLGEPTATYSVGDQWYSLRVTVQCTIAFYLGSVVFLGGLLALAPRVRLGRIFVATAIGMVGLTLLNQVRLLMITYFFGTWGREGFNWAHGPLGTILMLVGIAAVLLLFFVLCLKPGRKQERAEAQLRAEKLADRQVQA